MSAPLADPPNTHCAICTEPLGTNPVTAAVHRGCAFKLEVARAVGPAPPLPPEPSDPDIRAAIEAIYGWGESDVTVALLAGWREATVHAREQILRVARRIERTREKAAKGCCLHIGGECPATTAGPLCRCPPGFCLLHQLPGTCSLRERALARPDPTAAIRGGGK